jgi:hypothetical protein
MAGGEKWRKRRAAKQAAAAAAAAAATAAATATSAPPPRPQTLPLLTSMLPAELQLAVLSHLPVAQIQRCRALSRHMRDLVDGAGNQAICAQGGLEHAQQKFAGFMATYVEYDVDAVDELHLPCAFFNTLVAYTKLRGIAEFFCIKYWRFMRDFAAHWLERCLAADGAAADPTDSFGPSTVSNIVWVVHRLHLHHQDDSPSSSSADDIADRGRDLQDKEALVLMRLAPDQLGAAILQKVADGAMEGVVLHREGAHNHCTEFECPYEFKLCGNLSKLGRKEPELDDEGAATAADASAADALAAQSEESTWSEVPKKRALRGTHLTRLEARQPDQRFSLSENQTSPETDDNSEDDNSYGDVAFELRKKFGLPELPDGLPFAYYARSRRDATMIKAILESDKKLSMLERAGMLDRIFIW